MFFNRRSCCNPEFIDDDFWLQRHKYMISQAGSKEFNAVLLGASLVEFLQYNEIWNEEFKPLNTFNMGIGGDRIENLLWRIENGAIDTLKTKTIAILVGSNNVTDSHANVRDIANGIFKIASICNKKQPNAIVIILGLPPKEPTHNIIRDLLENVNQCINELVVQSDNKNIKYLNCHLGFVNPKDGTLSKDDFYDYLHFTENGYRKFCKPLLTYLKTILNPN